MSQFFVLIPINIQFLLFIIMLTQLPIIEILQILFLLQNLV